MDREGPYLPIDTKINFIGVRFGKSREGVVTTPLVRRVTRNSLERRGLKELKTPWVLDGASSPLDDCIFTNSCNL